MRATRDLLRRRTHLLRRVGCSDVFMLPLMLLSVKALEYDQDQEYERTANTSRRYLVVLSVC